MSLRRSTMEEINQPQRYSAVWEYFTKKPNYIANCNICKKDYSYKASLSNLTKHRRRKHMKRADDDITDCSDDETSIHRQGKRANASAVWKFMEVTDDEAKNAVCLICRKQLSFMTGTSNLRKHIQRVHSHIMIDDDVLDSSDKKVIISTDGQLYEIAESDGERDPIQTDQVYLEESMDNNDIIEQNITPPKRIKHTDKKLKRKLVTKELFQNSDTSIEPEYTCDKYSKKNTSKDDSLDIFGQYVISLLRQLPENVSDQLQSEFIKQIFAAKIAMKTSFSVTVNEKPITVTITNGANNSIPEITVHNTSDVIMTENTEKSFKIDTSNEK